MKNVSFEGDRERHYSVNDLVSNSKKSRPRKSQVPNLNNSASIMPEKNPIYPDDANISNKTGRGISTNNSLISKIAKTLSGKKLTDWPKRSEEYTRKREINQGNSFKYRDQTEYGTLKPYLQLRELKNESHHASSVAKQGSEVNHSFIGKTETSFIQQKGFLEQNENISSAGNQNNARSRSLPPIENRLQATGKQQSSVLSDLNVQQNDRVVYNPRSKYPYKLIKGQGPENEVARRTNYVAGSQVAKYLKDSISPLLDIKCTFMDPKQDRDNKMRIYLQKLEEQKQKRISNVSRNKDDLYHGLATLKPQAKFNEQMKKIPRHAFEEEKLGDKPNESTLEHLSLLEKQTIENIATTTSLQKRIFENGIITREEMAIAKIQGRIGVVQANDVIYGPSMKDVGRGGLVTNEEISVREATAFWHKNIGNVEQTRWDLFEECIRIFIEETVPEALTYFRQFNLVDFFSFLRAKLGHYEAESKAPEIKLREVIESPLCKGDMKYIGPVITLGTLLQFTRLYGLKYMFTHLFHEFFLLLKKQGYQLETLLDEKNAEWSGTSSKVEKHYGTYQYGCGSWYKGEWRRGVKHGKGRLILVTGDSYEGDFMHGKRHGYGIQTFNRPIKGVIYKGEWKDDLRHGYGAAEWPDGTFFQGKWENGIQVFGTFVWPFEGEYTGHWNGAEMEGEGTFESKDGDVYKGYWKNSLLNGEAERKTANGEIYRGVWIDNQLGGISVIITDIGKYEGEVVNSVENGHGTMVWSDKSTYTGEWKDGLPHKKGKFVSSSAEIYEGDFIEGRKEGRGRKVFSNGDIYDGEWFNDKMTGEGTMIYANYRREEGNVNPRYTGFWRNGVRDGYGVMIYEDQSVYEGDWIDGKRHGRGKLKLVFHNMMGLREEMNYEGEFQNDAMHGYGIMVWPNGDIYKGDWINSKREGRGELKIGNEDWIKGLFSNDMLVDASITKTAAKQIEKVEKFKNRLREDMFLQPDQQREKEENPYN